MEPSPVQKRIMGRVESDRDELVGFLRGFLRARSPNPPGDTREAAAYVTSYLDRKGISFKVIGPDKEKPNIVSSFSSGEGRRLVLNGHMDVFPVGDGAGWSHDPWGGELVDGRVYGRGACAMKAGTPTRIYTYVVLHELMNEILGGATLTVVSDEEAGGRLGSGWLVENLPETMGDCCVTVEPSSPYTLRFGEKGILWLRVTVRTPGGHGAYTHTSANAIKIASRLVTDLETLKDPPVHYPENLAKALEEGRDAAEKALGRGGADVMAKVRVNGGVFSGGVKGNVIPRECVFEVDLRLPPGLAKEDVMHYVERIVAMYPEAEVDAFRYDGPLWSQPGGGRAVILG